MSKNQQLSYHEHIKQNSSFLVPNFHKVVSWAETLSSKRLLDKGSVLIIRSPVYLWTKDKVVPEEKH